MNYPGRALCSRIETRNVMNLDLFQILGARGRCSQRMAAMAAWACLGLAVVCHHSSSVVTGARRNMNRTARVTVTGQIPMSRLRVQSHRRRSQTQKQQKPQLPDLAVTPFCACDGQSW
jgi:hypothetical protein